MLACDAKIIPAVLGGASEVLDVGRSMRTFTAACRTAILLTGRRLRVPRLWPARPVGGVPPHPTLGRRRTIGPAQRMPAVQTPPHAHPPGAVAGPDGHRPAPRDHPADQPRPGTTTPAQHPAPTTDLRLAPGRLTQVGQRPPDYCDPANARPRTFPAIGSPCQACTLSPAGQRVLGSTHIGSPVSANTCAQRMSAKCPMINACRTTLLANACKPPHVGHRMSL